MRTSKQEKTRQRPGWVTEITSHVASIVVQQTNLLPVMTAASLGSGSCLRCFTSSLSPCSEPRESKQDMAVGFHASATQVQDTKETPEFPASLECSFQRKMSGGEHSGQLFTHASTEIKPACTHWFIFQRETEHQIYSRETTLKKR